MAGIETNEDKRPVGRPLKIKDAEELSSKIEAYFGNCDPHIIKVKVRKERADGTTYWAEDETVREQRSYTMSGLAHALGISRQTLLDYGGREEFLDTIEDAKEKVHRFAEEQLFGKSSPGAAFSLKNNWGWKDKHDYDHTSGGKRIEAPAIYVSDIAHGATVMLQLKLKQVEAVQAVNDPTVDTLVLLGVVGSGKTDVAAHIDISIAHKFPKTYWPVFRQNMSTAIETIIPSYLEMADKMGFEEGKDFFYNQQAKTLTFKNKSVIAFVEADPTKGRGGKKIKGINASGNHIDEADELEFEMFIQATSRKGRRDENGQPSISIVTMNPNDGWAKELYYDRWKDGTLPSNVRVIEFDLSDS